MKKLRFKTSIYELGPAMVRQDVASCKWARYRIWCSASNAKNEFTTSLAFDNALLQLTPQNSYPIEVYGHFQHVIVGVGIDEHCKILVDSEVLQETGA